jgi:hypothetical protein
MSMSMPQSRDALHQIDRCVKLGRAVAHVHLIFICDTQPRITY